MKRQRVGALLAWMCLIAGGCDVSEDTKPVDTGFEEDTTTTPTGTSSSTSSSSTADRDGDGFSIKDGDCDDDDPTAFPGADELCDTIDNDCDDSIDEDAIDAFEWYPDADGDGYGLNGAGEVSCPPADGAYALSDGDCDDEDPNCHKFHLEMPGDGIDSNCDTIDGSFEDVHPGTVQIDTIEDQRAFCEHYTSIAGALYLPNSTATDVGVLGGCLQTISGTLEISSETLVSVDMDALQSVGGHLVIEGATSLKEVVLPSLDRIERDLYVTNNPDLIRLEVWDLCEVLNLSINENPNLESVTMPGLLTINGNLAIRDSTWMREFEAEDLESIAGDLLLRNLNDFQLLSLPRLENIGPAVTESALVLEKGEQRDFRIIDSRIATLDMPALLSISGDLKFENVFEGPVYELTQLRAVGGDFKFINTGLEQFNFKDLTHIGGNLRFEQNYYLNDMGGGAYEGLGGLSEVGGDFTLSYNHTMTSMIALLASMTSIGGDYTVTNNAQLPESQAVDMSDTVDIGGATEIFGNLVSTSTMTAGTAGTTLTTTGLPTGGSGTAAGSSAGSGTGTGS